MWPSPGGESAQTAGSNWWTSSALCRPGGYDGSMDGKAAGSGRDSAAIRELLQLAVSAAPKAVGLPPRLKELGGRSVPTMFLYQLLHLREDCFGERARVVLPIPPHLDVNEDAEDVLPEAPAVDMPLDVPDPVHRLWPRVVVGLLDAEDYVGVVLLAVLHLAEDDVPNANLGGLLLE